MSVHTYFMLGDLWMCFFIYHLFLSPPLYYLLINPRLKQKIGSKISTNVNITTPIWAPLLIKEYYGIPIEVSRYITYKFILKILSFDADSMKVGDSTLQRLNYSTKRFSFFEIFFCMFHFLTCFLSVAYSVVILYFNSKV